MKSANMVVIGVFGAAAALALAACDTQQKTGCIVDGDGARVVNLETGRVTIRSGLKVDHDKKVCLYSEGSGPYEEIPIVSAPWLKPS